MTALKHWIGGARPRTLPAAVVPVAIGTAVAVQQFDPATSAIVVNGLCALVVALALQVAVNYANDYSDGVRGTDTERVGPIRLVGSGLARAAAVKRAAFAAFGVAGVAGGVLVARVSWWLVPVGVVCVAAAWLYTGGPRPYGYLGLGEVFVFVFFGLVATVGTTYVVARDVSRLSVVAGALAGVLAVALLVVNNIRDIEGDARSGKRTLAVRLGPSGARRLYVGCYVVATVLVAVAAIDAPVVLIAAVGLLAALPAISTVRGAATSQELISALGMTARVQLVVGTLFVLGVLFS